MPRRARTRQEGERTRGTHGQKARQQGSLSLRRGLRTHVRGVLPKLQPTRARRRRARRVCGPLEGGNAEIQTHFRSHLARRRLSRRGAGGVGLCGAARHQPLRAAQTPSCCFRAFGKTSDGQRQRLISSSAQPCSCSPPHIFLWVPTPPKTTRRLPARGVSCRIVPGPLSRLSSWRRARATSLFVTTTARGVRGCHP